MALTFGEGGVFIFLMLFVLFVYSSFNFTQHRLSCENCLDFGRVCDIFSLGRKESLPLPCDGVGYSSTISSCQWCIFCVMFSIDRHQP